MNRLNGVATQSHEIELFGFGLRTALQLSRTQREVVPSRSSAHSLLSNCTRYASTVTTHSFHPSKRLDSRRQLSGRQHVVSEHE